jgi:DNA-binding MarR family transcriptional regulator
MELTDGIVWLLKQAFYFSLTLLNDAVSEHGVSTAQLGLMRQLTNQDGLSGAELARRLLITPQGVADALASLERRGLVERRPAPEHSRTRLAYLTDEGRRVTAAALAEALTRTDEIFGVLTVDEQQTLRDLLRRVVEQGTGHALFSDSGPLA